MYLHVAVDSIRFQIAQLFLELLRYPFIVLRSELLLERISGGNSSREPLALPHKVLELALDILVPQNKRLDLSGLAIDHFDAAPLF